MYSKNPKNLVLFLFISLSFTLFFSACDTSFKSSTNKSTVEPAKGPSVHDPAAITPAPTPTPTVPAPGVITSVKLAAVGHSLVNTTMPTFMMDIAQLTNKIMDMKVQIIGGSTLNNNWNNHASAQQSGNYFGDVFNALAVPGVAYDVFVMTERIPVQLSINSEGSHDYARRWRDRAVQFNPNARIYLYSTWLGVGGFFGDGVSNRSEWRSRTESDGAIFERLAEEVNSRITSGPKINIVPGHLAMMALYDAIQSRTINWAPAGADGINYFFSDDVHLNDLGNYYIACVQYASVFKTSPVGSAVPARISGILTAPQANQLQRLAWEVVSRYRYSGF